MTTTNNREKKTDENRKIAETKTQLQSFFTGALKDIYWAEKYLVKSLPKMQSAATTDQLQQAIGNHIAQTEEHVSRLEKVFAMLGERAQGKKCDAMEALILEGESVVGDTQDGSMTRDAGLIISAQKVEHYEIAVYGSLVQIARTMGHDDIAKILGQTLNEEKETDKLLTEIAEVEINWEAEYEGALGAGRIL